MLEKYHDSRTLRRNLSIASWCLLAISSVGLQRCAANTGAADTQLHCNEGSAGAVGVNVDIGGNPLCCNVFRGRAGAASKTDKT